MRIPSYRSPVLFSRSLNSGVNLLLAISFMTCYDIAMKNKYFHISADEKMEIVDNLKGCIENQQNISFCYVHGSFLTDNHFKDIDIAVYIGNHPSSLLRAELELETELASAVERYPVDVRILNNAPLSFRYNVIKHGQPIVVHDEDLRSDFVEATLSHYFDFSPFLRNYLKEALKIGIQQ